MKANTTKDGKFVVREVFLVLSCDIIVMAI